MDARVSMEDPTDTAPSEPAGAPLDSAVAPPAPSPPLAGLSSGATPFLIGAFALALFALGAYVFSQSGGLMSGSQSAGVYTVAPYTPPSQLVSAHDHVMAYVRPDTASPGVIMFGPGVALTVTGRVSRGFANDWYAITWDGHTAFVRQQDAVAGAATAPPPTAPRVAPLPPRVEEKPDADVPDFPDEAPPPVASGPFELRGVRWASRPGRRDYERAYPERALNNGQSGHVTLDCIASGSGALDCSVAVELPRGYGFGGAALGLARQFRLEATTSDGRPVAGGHIQVPVEFRAS
jgi:TonB family protein